MAYKLYTSKLNIKSDLLWQKPRQGYIHYNDTEWYESNRVGQKSLEAFMKTLIKEAKLDINIYTNHSICATCITTLDKHSFEARHITAISGHKSESTIKTYSVKCPDSKKREMYETLKDSLIPKKQKKERCATITSPLEPELATINTDDIESLNMNMSVNEATNSRPDLPANFDLIPFDLQDESDDFLIDYMNSNPQIQQLEKANTTKIVSTTSTTMTTRMPVIPKMYFPNSNVMINYNFNAK